jgi:hypothetical protein
MFSSPRFKSAPVVMHVANALAAEVGVYRYPSTHFASQSWKKMKVFGSCSHLFSIWQNENNKWVEDPSNLEFGEEMRCHLQTKEEKTLTGSTVSVCVDQKLVAGGGFEPPTFGL